MLHVHHLLRHVRSSAQVQELNYGDRAVLFSRHWCLMIVCKLWFGFSQQKEIVDICRMLFCLLPISFDHCHCLNNRASVLHGCFGPGGRRESGGLHAATVEHLWEILSDMGTTKRVSSPVIVCTSHFKQQITVQAEA